jgi:heat shock protein HslJ
MTTPPQCLRRSSARATIAVLAIVLLAAVLAACSDAGPDVSSKTGGSDTGTPATSSTLEANGWTLESYVDSTSGNLTGASSTKPATAKFDGSTMSGTNGCNSYSAPYTLGSGGSISIKPAASTMMACSDASITAQEQGFNAALQKATKAVIADGKLQMLGASGDTLLIFHSS